MERKKRKLRVKIIYTCLILKGIVALIAASAALSTFLFLMLEGQEPNREYFRYEYILNLMQSNQIVLMLFISILTFAGVVFLYLNSSGRGQNFQSRMKDITSTIQTPMPAGQSQHGSAKWLNERRHANVFATYIIDKKKNRFIAKLIQAGNISKTRIYDTSKGESLKCNAQKFVKDNTQLLPRGGVVIGYELLNKHKEQLFFLDDDVHSLILGATRSGKTRCLFLQSICLIALAGESMIISDPKGEIYDYIAPFLRYLGYKVIVLDFKTPTKSQRYNFLQPIINAMNAGDLPKAIELVWDITSSLVPKTKGERIWQDGEASVIAGAIMAVVYDNKDKPELQNLTNVYYFIGEMCKTGDMGKMPLDRYLDDVGEKHPAKALFETARIAPSRTRGSFFTAALTNLRLFTSPYIYNMTSNSDFDLSEVGNSKHAVFIILPDGKETYNGLASLFVYQQYQALLENADSKGGRLDVRTNFMLEEFGNFTKIPSFTQMLTVGGGRGIRLNLVIQSFAQIEDVYGREQADTIKDNCHCLVYLHSENSRTNEEISRRLGKYTTSSYGRSNNTTSRSSMSSSASVNLIGRDLLTPDEVKKIERPYVLIMYSGYDPAIMVMPDISKWFFNQMLGLGDKEFNQKLRMYISSKREVSEQKEFVLWQGIKIYQDDYQNNGNSKKTDEKGKFLGLPLMGDSDDLPGYSSYHDEYADDSDEKQGADDGFDGKEEVIKSMASKYQNQKRAW